MIFNRLAKWFYEDDGLVWASLIISSIPETIGPYGNGILATAERNSLL